MPQRNDALEAAQQEDRPAPDREGTSLTIPDHILGEVMFD